MADISTLGPDKVLVYRTENFETRVDASGEGIMRRRDTSDMVYARPIPAAYAAEFTEVAETGYALGLERTGDKLREFARTFADTVTQSLPTSTSGFHQPSIEKKDADD